MNLFAILSQVNTDSSTDNPIEMIYKGLFSDNPAAKQTFLRTLMLFAAIPLVLWLVYRVQQRWNSSPSSHPARLLWELGSAASLGITDRWLLMRIARQEKQENPAALLLSANTFDRVVGGWLRKRGNAKSARLKRLRQHLFGGDTPPTAA